MSGKTVNLRDLPEDLIRRAKAAAAMNGMTLKDWVTDCIRKKIDETERKTGVVLR